MAQLGQHRFDVRQDSGLVIGDHASRADEHIVGKRLIGNCPGASLVGLPLHTHLVLCLALDGICDGLFQSF